MGDSLMLAWQYLRHHRLTTAVLVASIVVIMYLPVALHVIVRSAEDHFRSRARSTPLVIGPRGSPLELVLSAVYFDRPSEAVLRLKQLRRVEEQQLGAAIPLHVRHTARDCQVVGTSRTYFRERQLRIARGNLWKLPGECVLGAAVAQRLQVSVGDRIPASSSTPFLLDAPPLRLRISGILSASESPDDEVVFVNLDTAWILDGLGHGHARGAAHGSPEAALATDITAENAKTFHFHGNRSEFPITAICVIPAGPKQKTILQGQYFSADETAQVVDPAAVIGDLLHTVVMVRSYMIAVVAVVSLSTLLLLALVVALSLRLRRQEVVTMWKIGCSRGSIASILGSQILIVLLLSAIITGVLALATRRFGPELAAWLIL